MNVLIIIIIYDCAFICWEIISGGFLNKFGVGHQDGQVEYLSLNTCPGCRYPLLLPNEHTHHDQTCTRPKIGATPDRRGDLILYKIKINIHTMTGMIFSTIIKVDWVTSTPITIHSSLKIVAPVNLTTD